MNNKLNWIKLTTEENVPKNRQLLLATHIDGLITDLRVVKFSFYPDRFSQNMFYNEDTNSYSIFEDELLGGYRRPKGHTSSFLVLDARILPFKSVKDCMEFPKNKFLIFKKKNGRHTEIVRWYKQNNAITSSYDRLHEEDMTAKGYHIYLEIPFNIYDQDSK